MSLERAKNHLASYHLAERILLTAESSATVELAALAVGTEPRRIAKSMSFFVGEDPILILAAGDARVDNRKFKDQFHVKARMIPFDQVEAAIGHAPGGVCPFGANENVVTWLDESLRRFETVFPAAGTGNSAIELTLSELEQASRAAGWVDVCKDWV